MSLSHVFIVASVASLVLTASAGYTDNSATSATSSDWNAPATASVYSNTKETMPKGAVQVVELLRFVTAFKEGFETLVDITPYSALLRSASDTDGNLKFFAFIDTWVGNSTPEAHHVMSLDEKGQCKPKDRMQEAWGGGGREGNGWGISADMIFWPRTGFVDTRPRETMTISSGYYGSYSIGGITTHEGTVIGDGSSIELKDPTDFTGTLDAKVYPCPDGGQSVERGYKKGNLAKELLQLQQRGDTPEIESIIKKEYDELVGDAVTVVSAGTQVGSQRVEVTFDPSSVTLVPGMPVWYAGDDIYVENSTATPGMFPGNPVGSVIKVDGTKAIIQINGPCVPGNATNWLPHLKVEKHRGALAHAEHLAKSLQHIGSPPKQRRSPSQTRLKRQRSTVQQGGFISFLAEHAGRVRQTEEANAFWPDLVAADRHGNYDHLVAMARVNLEFLRGIGNVAPASVPIMPSLSLLQTTEHGTLQRETAGDYQNSRTSLMNDGERVCILARRATGRVFERTFNIPSFLPAGQRSKVANPADSAVHPSGAGAADRVLLQFTVTGHGWSGSTEQCGEFCHSIYHINVNGKNSMNVTQWRDCKDNPVNDQSGTWSLARDGWCPGSVEPGLYLDITKWLKNDRNTISVDLSVWSGSDNKYEKYTNYGNYLGGGDGAVLDIGATLFIYDGAAVEAIGQQTQAYTAAERALLYGSSAPKAHIPPRDVMNAFSKVTPEATAEGLELIQGFAEQQGPDPRTTRNLRGRTGAEQPLSFLAPRAETRYNHELRAPWYAFDSESAEDSKWLAGAKVVPAFTNGVIQINSREIEATVERKNIPEEWGHAALRFKIGSPKGGEKDNWDRVGSLGLVFKQEAASAKDASKRVILRPSRGSTMMQKTAQLVAL